MMSACEIDIFLRGGAVKMVLHYGCLSLALCGKSITVLSTRNVYSGTVNGHHLICVTVQGTYTLVTHCAISRLFLNLVVGYMYFRFRKLYKL